MAKLAQRRLSPKTTLKQLAHIKTWAPTCPKCGERIHKINDKSHICKENYVKI